MITGIQITKAANDDLLNSFWLLDNEKRRSALPVRQRWFCGR
ncbi:Pyruvate formate-lyase [Klebsiella pneumoniae IS43]|uniref:Pyruvate formate-lyase n=1 Tax=Klebsiella pneumoniae IS43 TaxID=1432552 RepID=W1DKZ0_KLEPN|nr:Pyruvate formate-lyase [Klebsiella pneumoniae IS43]